MAVSFLRGDTKGVEYDGREGGDNLRGFEGEALIITQCIFKIFSIKEKQIKVAGAITELLRALTALTDNSGSFLNIHMEAPVCCIPRALSS